MVQLYAYNMATLTVLAIFQGPDGVSCEHAAGAPDEAGETPYCKEGIAWSFSTTIRIPRQIAEGERVNPRRVYEHKHEGKVIGRYLRDLTKAEEKGVDPIPHKNLVHDEAQLIIPADVPVINVDQFDADAEIGTPGAPHRMTQAQLDAHHEQQLAEVEKTATRHGLRFNRRK